LQYSDRYLKELYAHELQIQIADEERMFDKSILYASGFDDPPDPSPSYVARVFPRRPLGTSHELVAEMVATNIMTHPDVGDRCQIAVDISGPGDGAIRHFGEEGLEIQPVRIVGGFSETKVLGKDGYYRHHVARINLLSPLRAMIERKVQRLEILETTDEASILIQEMLNFDPAKGTDSSKTDQQLDWRTNMHDDLVFALALAVWSAESHGPGGGLDPEERGEDPNGGVTRSRGEMKPPADDELFGLGDSLR